MYGFQGGRFDPLDGLINFRNRDLNPTTGTWMEQDPAGYVDGGNLYQFVEANPTDFTDPTGLRGPYYYPGMFDHHDHPPGPPPPAPEPHTSAPGGPRGPYQLGWEWLWDTDDPTDLAFYGNDNFTKGLQRGDGAAQGRVEAEAAAAAACKKGLAKGQSISGTTYYAPGVKTYAKDYLWNVPFGKFGVGNPYTAFVGVMFSIGQLQTSTAASTPRTYTFTDIMPQGLSLPHGSLSHAVTI